VTQTHPRLSVASYHPYIVSINPIYSTLFERSSANAAVSATTTNAQLRVSAIEHRQLWMLPTTTATTTHVPTNAADDVPAAADAYAPAATTRCNETLK
jgi:hypothetical protein